MMWVVMMTVTPPAPGSDVSRGIAIMNLSAQHLGKKGDVSRLSKRYYAHIWGP
jgi:hypothetical protein